MINSIAFTEPELCHYDYDLKQSWFVYFDITNLETGETKRKQFRGGINFFKTKEDRLLSGRALKKWWSQKLKDGWHPFEQQQKAPDLLSMDFKQAVNFALDKCKLAKKTMQGYAGTSRFVIASAEALKLSTYPISSIKRMHIKMMLEHAMQSNSWTNASYNKHLNYLQCILTRLTDWEIIENNPAHKITSLAVAETEKYVPYTDAEKKAIQECLFVNHYRFYVFFLVEYYTGIRPKEILSLKIKDIDLINSQITILPDLDRENAKTKKIRKVPVNKHLLSFLRELQLQDYPKNYYVFGSPYVTGSKVNAATHPDYFKPSLQMVKRDTVTKLWKKVIKDKLGVDKYLYAGKATGANAMISAGIDLDSLKELYGHASSLMTERYASEVKKVRFNEIIEKAPQF